jgi:4-nitrophenyl phosphatase
MNLSNIKALILDMDGVLWKDDTPIGDLPTIFARIRERGLKVALATNNATRTIDEYLAKLSGFNVTLVSSFDRSVTYSKLSRATLHIRAGVPFYGTNPDKTFPTPEGLVPGAGAILASIESATSVEPIIIGKPKPAMMYMALERLGMQPEETLVVGDRLETDIAAGQAAGCKTALVLSGVSTRRQAEAWQPVPDLIVDDLCTLIE